jgi:Holliday junction resolvase
MINLDLNNLINKIILIVLVVVLLYLGWKIRKIYKRFIFFLHKKRGRNSERKAIKLLIKKGYKVIHQQLTTKGYLYENGNKVGYKVRPDFMVTKDKVTYVAEIKTGLSASIETISTRRQLLEYSKLFNSSKVILVDISKKEIKVIEF